MEVESTASCRKRTESNGGSSDSDISEGWNIVDHLDANCSETLSSDGESVEVIEPEEESSLNADAESDKEVDVTVIDNNQLVSKLDCPPALMPADELPSLAVPPPREEIFDSSFCWFLVTATLAVLASHLAILAAENVFEWNTNFSIDSPSFLKDLPITTKPLHQSNLVEKISWASDEDVTVDSPDGELFTKTFDKIIDKSSLPTDKTKTDKQKQETRGAEIKDRPKLKITDNYDLDNYLKNLTDITSSVDAKKKFAQTILILEFLQIGINDLEEVVSKSPDLNHMLKKQKNKLNDVVTEIKFGMARTLEKLATNILNKVRTLERRFENQWCKLEKSGHKEELGGLFYDCEEPKHEVKENFKSDNKLLEESKSRIDFKNNKKMKTIRDSYKYEVDKDSTGKVSSKEHTGNGGSNDYYNLVKDGKNDKIKSTSTDHKKMASKFSSTQENIKGEHSKQSSEKQHLKKEKQYLKIEKELLKKEKHLNKEKNSEKHSDGKYEMPKEKQEIKKPLPLEIVGRFLKERCTKIMENNNSSVNLKSYHKLKEEIDTKLKISKELFDKLYFKFCLQSSQYTKRDKQEKKYFKNIHKETLKKKRKFVINKEVVFQDPAEKNINFEIVESSEEHLYDRSRSNVIEPTDQKKWTLSFEVPPKTNKTNKDGSWFFKAGVSRSHIRWVHQRSDWLFDRAFQRRRYLYRYPDSINWFQSRHKNWFIRRAWARQQCRVSSQNNWHHHDDETITIPNSNFS